MRIRSDERSRVKATAAALIPVIYEEKSRNWLLSFHEAEGNVTRNIIMFGIKGKHLNSLAWRVARRFGPRWKPAWIAEQ